MLPYTGTTDKNQDWPADRIGMVFFYHQNIIRHMEQFLYLSQEFFLNILCIIVWLLYKHIIW